MPDPPMQHLLNYHEDCLNQQKNSQKLCNETRHPTVNFMVSWVKLLNLGKSIVEQILALEKRNESKRAGLWG